MVATTTDSNGDWMRGWNRWHWRRFGHGSAIALAVALGVIYLICWLVFNRVPSGVQNPLAYIGASCENPDLVSPDGKHVLKVRYNDAGAAHSGNHWTWIIRRSMLGWDEVIAQGYVVTPWEGTPAWWLDNDTCEIRFVRDRYAGVLDEPIILFYHARSGRLTSTPAAPLND